MAGGACSTPVSPTQQPPASTQSPAITGLAITGLPQPLLFDIPASVKAGRSYTVGATASFADGSSGAAKASSLTWSTSDSAVASVSGGTLQPHREGTINLTVSGGGFTVSRELTVRGPEPVVREVRAESIKCERLVCPYPFCPWTGPYWLFPVYEDGTIELLSVKNPGWGSPHNQVIQLSPKGERIDSWQLGREGPESTESSTASVPGGFMYVFIMEANLMCGDAAAVWTRPN